MDPLDVGDHGAALRGEPGPPTSRRRASSPRSTRRSSAPAHIVLVDDDDTGRETLRNLLGNKGYEVETASDGVAALDLVTKGPLPDLVLTDLRMPVVDGIELVARIHERAPELPVVVFTGFGDVGSAVGAMRAGAEDYLTKPLDFEALDVCVRRTLARRARRLEEEAQERALAERETVIVPEVLGKSPAMRRICRLAAQVASTRATVLLTGESGTGKGALARAIHARSERAGRPFVSLHCAALPPTLLESELFGHEKGSFTGAERQRTGRFEQADGGTLFLDEVGEVSMTTQVKLLRFLQERTFERVGGNESVKVDVRIIAATNRDLAADTRSGRFREDLFYRLNVVQIDMPPLRDRGADVLLLADEFLRRFAREAGKTFDGFAAEARGRLAAYSWPGNVRELENAIERAVVVSEGPLVEADVLPSLPLARPASLEIRAAGCTLAEMERYAIVTTLEAANGSTTRTAEILGISVRTVQYRLHQYGISSKNIRPDKA